MHRILLPLVLLAACGQPSAEPITPTTLNATAPTIPAPALTVSPGATTNVELAVGMRAPSLRAKAHDGVELDLAALKGKPVVVYFYPRDETPGCTKEACSFRDAWASLAKTGVVMIGVSTDDNAAHEAFAKHHNLPFHLVSDSNAAIAKAFGVPNNGGFLGRQTFVIGADGNIKKIYRSVDVSKHAAEVLADLSP